MRQTWTVCMLLAATAGTLLASAAPDEPAAQPAAEPPSVELDDPAQLLVPVRPRTSADEDRVRVGV